MTMARWSNVAEYEITASLAMETMHDSSHGRKYDYLEWVRGQKVD